MVKACEMEGLFGHARHSVHGITVLYILGNRSGACGGRGKQGPVGDVLARGEKGGVMDRRMGDAVVCRKVEKFDLSTPGTAAVRSTLSLAVTSALKLYFALFWLGLSCLTLLCSCNCSARPFPAPNRLISMQEIG